jgi:ribonuclease HI
MMTAPRTHYLLFSEASFDDAQGGAWRFVLEHVATGQTFAARDVEEGDCPERLELLALVRGLEAIDQPARVTLVTKSRYVSRGLEHGLAEWRTNGWQWERFGRLAPVRDHDLWKRVDRALAFHQVECRLWRFDDAAEPVAAAPAVEASGAPPRPRRRFAAAARRRLESASRAAAALGGALRPAPLAAG